MVNELPQADKKDWTAIELTFCKLWLKEEVIGIKEIVTTKNEHQPEPITSHVPTTTTHTVTDLNVVNNDIHVDFDMVPQSTVTTVNTIPSVTAATDGPCTQA